MNPNSPRRHLNYQHPKSNPPHTHSSDDYRPVSGGFRQWSRLGPGTCSTSLVPTLKVADSQSMTSKSCEHVHCSPSCMWPRAQEQRRKKHLQSRECPGFSLSMEWPDLVQPQLPANAAPRKAPVTWLCGIEFLAPGLSPSTCQLKCFNFK